MRRKLINLANQRNSALQEAEAALQANNQAAYTSAMERVANLNTEIQQVQDLITEQERNIDMRQPSGAEVRDVAEERGSRLMRGESVTFDTVEIRRALTNQFTVGSGNIVEPTGAGSTIHDGPNGVVSSIVDQVYVQDLTGLSGWQEPYIITELTADKGTPAAKGGTARTDSTPTFGVADIKPYEVSVTTYVDKNISDLSPVAYYAKIQTMAMRAMRREIAKLIINGDGAATPTVYGLTNAKNTKGANIFAALALGSTIDVDTLDELYFAYGSDEAVGGNARLLLTKQSLKALGKLRGTNEKGRLFTITPTAGNGNVGTISDGGVILPYTLCSAAGDGKLLYGDPINYMLGLFGGYSIRVDESYKAAERLHTILGDVKVGGNLTADKGFVVGSVTGGQG